MAAWQTASLEGLDLVVLVGNVMTRGAPVIEALLESGIPYTSGPEWLAREVLREHFLSAQAPSAAIPAVLR